MNTSALPSRTEVKPTPRARSRLAWMAAIVLGLVLTARSDLLQRDWVAELSRQGSPPPARDPSSPTGYAYSQRRFLGTHERGETYRWIATTQDLLASGPFSAGTYQSDTVPTGRPRLLPRLYAGWLMAVTWGVHLITGEPLNLAVERAALWEPIVSHVLAYLAVVVFFWRRYGAASAAAAGLCFAFLPPVFGQFLPGVLVPRTWALLLAAYAIALNLPARGDPRKTIVFSVRSALAAGLALWLDPAFGFPAVVVSAVAGATVMFTPGSAFPTVRWSVVGAAVTMAAWLIDRSPWDIAAGELRYVHPLYAIAWLGIGVALDGARHGRTSTRRRLRRVEIVAGVALISVLGYAQLKHDYKGWFYPSAALSRFTSLDENTAFGSGLDWIATASPVEVALVSAPALVALAALSVGLAKSRRRNAGLLPAFAPTIALLVAVLVLALLRVRWGVPAALIALAVTAQVASGASLTGRRIFLAGAALYVFGLIAWGTALPKAFLRPAAGREPSAEDVEALAYRHFAYWLASHPPGQSVSAMAPPELSDSLVFHGGLRVLMSTAWESYPGHVAASRILSAPESSEAEAVLQSREITHVILLSWDKVLPLLVRAPKTAGQDTLYARLQRWLLPPYLRAIPYHLPPSPGFASQQLTVFKVVPAQDEALALSRLAEYFVEMDRADLAGPVVRVLARVYPDNPNAVIARALVSIDRKDAADFERELAHLVADVSAGKSPFAWDRRVQRAIVLALARRHDLARREVQACVATASAETIADLTPLQAYRLRTLANSYGIPLPDPPLARRLASLGAEYSAASGGQPGAGSTTR